jgi:hypothetical protein
MKKMILAVVVSTVVSTVQCDLWQKPFYEPTVDDFCTQLYHDLAGLPPHDRGNIIQLTRQFLSQQHYYSYDTVSTDRAMQCVHSAIITHVENATLVRTNDPKLAASMSGNIRAELKKTLYIDASVVSQYCGTLLEERIKKARSYSHTPSPKHHNHHSPPRTPHFQTPSFSRATQEIQDTAKMLVMQSLMGEVEEYLRESNMPESDRTKVKKMFWNNCQNCHFSEADLYKCAKRQVREIVLENLDRHEMMINAQLTTDKEKRKLRRAARDISASIERALPDDSEKLNVQKVKNFCGTNLYDEIIACVRL